MIAEQLGRGLYGALIVDETDPPPADRDMLAVIADWRLDDKGAIVADFNAEADARGAGRIGSLVTLNSKPVPVLETAAPAVANQAAHRQRRGGADHVALARRREAMGPRGRRPARRFGLRAGARRLFPSGPARVST